MNGSALAGDFEMALSAFAGGHADPQNREGYSGASRVALRQHRAPELKEGADDGRDRRRRRRDSCSREDSPYRSAGRAARIQEGNKLVCFWIIKFNHNAKPRKASIRHWTQPRNDQILRGIYLVIWSGLISPRRILLLVSSRDRIRSAKTTGSSTPISLGLSVSSRRVPSSARRRCPSKRAIAASYRVAQSRSLISTWITSLTTSYSTIWIPRSRSPVIRKRVTDPAPAAPAVAPLCDHRPRPRPVIAETPAAPQRIACRCLV